IRYRNVTGVQTCALPIFPDLFREGQSVVATGHVRDGTFVATQVLAKHDETYMPPEVAKAIKKAEKAGRAHAEARDKAVEAAGKRSEERRVGEEGRRGGGA